MMKFLMSGIIVVSIVFSISTFEISEGRTLSPFQFIIDESMVDGKTWTYASKGMPSTIVMQGEKMELLLKISSSTNSPLQIDVHTTVSKHRADPKMPKDIEIIFEPDSLILSEKDETITMVVKVDENAPSSKYLVEIIGVYANGSLSTTFSLNIGKDYGPKAIAINTLDPPLKLYNYGVKAKEIECRLDFILILKNSNGSPACVTPSTAEKLIERGWTNQIFENKTAILMD